ncbi:MAG: MFS transporter [Lachnospiraceae bacterium]
MKHHKRMRPFGYRDKFGYMFGDFGNDFTFVLSSTFFLKFYTDVMGVPSAIVGILMMVAQLVDAVTDIGMGQLVDRSKGTKEGKFRPWIRRIMGPVALASFLMYASWFADMSMGFKVVWMFVTYLLWGSIFYTGIVIPYGSMASVISNDPVERTQLSTWRSVGGTLAMTFCSVVLPMIVYYTDTSGHSVMSGTRMTVAALICSVGALVCYALCYFLTTERVKIKQTKSAFELKAIVYELSHNRCLLAIVGLVLLREVSNQGLHGMAAYIYPNYFGNGAAQSASGVIETVIALVMATFIVKLAARFGKKELIAAGTLMSAVCLLLAFFVHTNSVIVWYIFYGFVTAGLAVFGLVGWALVSDIIDDTEVQTGRRIDGTIYGIYSFSRKAGQACSSAVTGIMLSMIGYTATTAFDPDIVDNIYNISCLLPMVGFILMVLVVVFLYPLNKKRVNENAAILEKRREHHRHHHHGRGNNPDTGNEEYENGDDGGSN